MLSTLFASSVLILGFCAQPEPAASLVEQSPAAAAAAVEAATLRAVWPVAESRRYVYSQQVVESSGPLESIENAVERKGTMRLGIRLTALDLKTAPKELSAEFLAKLEPGKATAAYSLTLETLRFTALRPSGEELVYDSTDAELSKTDNPFYSAAAPLVNVTVVMALDADGNIVAATGHEEFIVIGSPVARLAIQLIEPTSMGVKFGPLFGFFAPEAAAKAEATWKQARSVPYVPGIVLEVTDACTTEKVEGDVATIASVGTPTLRIPNPEKLGTREIKTNDFHATTTWNTAKGSLVKHEAVMFTEVLLNAVNNEPGSTAMVRSRTESVLEAAE